MKAKQIISTILCLVMLLGAIPLTASAEDTATASETSKVSFNELLDFNGMTEDANASAQSYHSMITDPTRFTAKLYSSNSNGSYFDTPDGDGDRALKLTSSQGITINTTGNFLKNGFLFEYDLRIEQTHNDGETSTDFNIVNMEFVTTGGTYKVGSTPVDWDGVATYIQNSQLTLTYTDSAYMPVTLKQWYKYSFYVSAEDSTVYAYRDGESIWYGKLKNFTADTITNVKFHLHSGHEQYILYYDNIRIVSLDNVSLNTFIDFENSAAGEASKNTFIAEGAPDFISSPHVSTKFTTIVTNGTNGTNNYLTAFCDGTSFKNTTYNYANFFLEDKAMRLKSKPWILSFDWRSEGTTKSDGSAVSFASATSGFLVLKKDSLTAAEGGTLLSMLGITSNGTIIVGGENTTYKATAKAWHKFSLIYSPETKKVNIFMDGQDIGTANADLTDATNTMIRFGYAWSGLYYKYNFDNITLKEYTPDADLNVFIDFEKGEVGNKIYPAELSAYDPFLSGSTRNTSSLAIDNSARANTAYAAENGNTFLNINNANSAIGIVDFTKKTLSEKFVFSFDFRLNQTPVIHTITQWFLTSDIAKTTRPQLLVINGSGTETVAGETEGESTTLTYGKLVAVSDTGGYSSAQKIYLNRWYNITLLIDPVKKTADFYLDNVKFASYKLKNDPTQFNYSALTISPCSSGASFDNVRIYTVKTENEKKEIDVLPADGTLFSTDFESLTAGTKMSKDVWLDLSSFETNSIGGSIAEANGNKYFISDTDKNTSLSFKVSNSCLTPYKDSVISIETDFAFGSNSANRGNLVIASIKRINTDGITINAPLLTSDAAGVLTVAQNKTNYTLPAKEVHIKLELSYIFHTVNLYVDGLAIATGIPLNVNTTMTLADTDSEVVTTVSDDAGNVYDIPYTGNFYTFAYDPSGAKMYGASGAPLYTAVYKTNYGTALTLKPHIKDYVEMFEASSATDVWSYTLDNLKIYIDEDADILYNGFDSWTTDTAAANVSTVQNPYNRSENDLSFIDINGNRVASTVSADESTNRAEGSLQIYDKDRDLNGKSFVLEYDLMYNSDYDGTSFTSLSVLAFVSSPNSNNNRSWYHSMRLFPDGNISWGDASNHAYYGQLKDDKWIHMQVMLSTKGKDAGYTATIYMNGVKAYTGSIGSFEFIRIGNEATSVYDLKFDNIRFYLADTPDPYEVPLDGTLDGNKYLSLEMADTSTRDTVMNNAKNGLVWNFKNFDTAVNNINGASVKVLLDMGSFIRVNHQYLNATGSDYNMSLSKSALGGYKQYVIETEIRYTCPTGFDLAIATVFDKINSTYDKLLYVTGTTREICFNRNGYVYTLTDENGNSMYVEDVTEEATKFTKLALIIDEEANNFSVYVNGNVAYYKQGDSIVSATEIEIDKLALKNSTSLPSHLGSSITLLDLPTSLSANALLDVKSLNVYVLRHGVAPSVVATQSKTNDVNAQTFDVRFIAPIDSLYGSEVGFDIFSKTPEIAGGSETKSSNIVYSSILAITDKETKKEEVVEAEYFDGSYIAIVSVTAANKLAGNIEFIVTPFVIIGDSKIYNKPYTVIYNDGKVVTE